VKIEEKNDLLIHSEIVFFPSRSGQQIVGYIDQADDCPGDADFVVITPKFGETKKNNLDLAYQLAANHLKVLRFDHTFHVGESEGGIENYRFSTAITDILSAFDYLELQHQVKSAQLLANSLSGRCALRVSAMDRRISRLLVMVGVVNFRSTAHVVYQQDMVEEFQAGTMQGISDILGHQVNVDAFLSDCIAENLHDFSGSIEDIKSVQSEVFFFCAERDVWVDLDEVKQLQSMSDLVTLYEIKGGMHELRENPEATKRASQSMIFASKYGELPRTGGKKRIIVNTDKKGLFQQNRIERERLRNAAPLRESEQDFWKSYLHKYNILESVGDYQDYLKLIGDCLGPIDPGLIYFDCGCGNGMFGAWCLRDILQQSVQQEGVPPVYFGLDLTAKGLADAAGKHHLTRSASREKQRALDLMYLRFDLDRLSDAENRVRLPLQDNSVDRICCSLLISYLKRPEILLGELSRILKPGGRIVVSSMKPYCDLSVIYKDVVEEAGGQQTLQAARSLLSAAGAIKLKEEEGHYKFYEKSELVEILQAGGFRRLKPYRSFGDQANLVTGEK